MSFGARNLTCSTGTGVQLDRKTLRQPLVIWDNTGVMHRVTPYPLDSGRIMHRSKLVGDEALA